VLFSNLFEITFFIIIIIVGILVSLRIS
jgi:hypothetical protein